ncbi:hypothetical protein [Streptomyces sp. NPDC051561]|uniref:hypothetical protein n=1 Tax=Streptomyces sp. NPDC051561 TaxID=3365658 RepID=UPI00379FF7B8
MSEHPTPPLGTLLGTRARDVQYLLEGLELPDTLAEHAGIAPLLQQIQRTRELGLLLLYELGKSSAASATPAGQHFVLYLTGAYTHCARASAHLATALQSQAEEALLGTGGASEHELGYRLGHAAAVRSLQRAQHVLEDGAERLASPAFARTPGKKPASPAEPTPQNSVPPPRPQR